MKSILITGCSSGIGYDCAKTLHQMGWTVFASCRKPEDCARLEAEGIRSPLIDLADPASLDGAIERIVAETGGTLDALFNNGAFAIPGAVEDLPTDGLREIFQTNLFSYHELTRQVIPIMRAQGHGRILNCSSVLGIVALRYRGAYNSTKFAMEGLSDTLRVEMQGTGIHVVLIEPGPITSKIRENARGQYEKWIEPIIDHSPWEDFYKTTARERLYRDTGKDRYELGPEAVLHKLIHAIESPRPRPRYYVTTPTYFAGTLKRLLPTRWFDAVMRRSG